MTRPLPRAGVVCRHRATRLAVAAAWQRARLVKQQEDKTALTIVVFEAARPRSPLESRLGCTPRSPLDACAVSPDAARQDPRPDVSAHSVPHAYKAER
jgi:acyl transferase domain-containing protein